MQFEQNTDTTIDRRKLFKKITVASIGGALSSTAIGQAVCRNTAAQTEGPFYPIESQDDVDWDLTRVKGATQEALGERVIIRGQVLDQNCEPVADALVEIWQACQTGRYNHPNDPNTAAALDPNFQYWGRYITDQNGFYMFKTIIPGQYPAAPGWIRPSHVHYKVHKRGYAELTTQMYFKGDRYNETDHILKATPEAERKNLIVEFRKVKEFDFPVGDFNVVLKKLF